MTGTAETFGDIEFRNGFVIIFRNREDSINAFNGENIRRKKLQIFSIVRILQVDRIPTGQRSATCGGVQSVAF